MTIAHRIYGTIIMLLLASTILLGLIYTGAQNDQKNTLAYILHLKQLSGVGMFNSTHIHADFKVYIDGKNINLNTEYHTSEPATIDEAFITKHNQFVHTHDEANDTDVMHIHATGITLTAALRAFGIQTSPQCITVSSMEHCDDGTKGVHYFVNDEQITDPGMYVVNDLDRILVSYGTDKTAQQQLTSVGRQACMQSHNCQ